MRCSHLCRQPLACHPAKATVCRLAWAESLENFVCSHLPRVRAQVLAGELRADGNSNRNARQQGVPVEVVLDVAVGFVMQEADIVVTGAAGVCESGGIVNKIGTYQVSRLALTAWGARLVAEAERPARGCGRLDAASPGPERSLTSSRGLCACLSFSGVSTSQGGQEAFLCCRRVI